MSLNISKKSVSSQRMRLGKISITIGVDKESNKNNKWQYNNEQWLKRGVSHYNANRYEEALTAYDQALQLDPTYIKAVFGRGNAL
jgi:tetratricopeptide (TPR) repeat protein